MEWCVFDSLEHNCCRCPHALPVLLGPPCCCAQHRDSGAYKYSAVLYLAPDSPPQLGTSTWKHRATGLYGDPTEADVARHNRTAEALLEALVDDPSQEKYDEIDRVGNRFNRLLVRDLPCVCASELRKLIKARVRLSLSFDLPVQIFNSKLNHRSSQLGGLGSTVDNGRLILILFFNTQDLLGQENSILYHDKEDAYGDYSSSGRNPLSSEKNEF